MKKVIFSLAILGMFFLSSCSNDEDDVSVNSNVTLDIDGLSNLGANYKYEGWIIVDGAPVSTGVFSVNDAGELSQSTFSVKTTDLNSATKFVLSIEPANDSDPAPAATKLLAGDFSGTTANVSSNNLLGDFTSATGKYILATPTDMDKTNEASGVWFLDNSSGMPATGLTLPTLPSGWKYEGWVVLNGTPVSTGTFTDVAMADDNAIISPYKGTSGNGPAFPGEDYVMGSAAGVNFPTDLKGATVVISVEPYPDNSAAPFTLKPLAHMVPANAGNHTVINMGAGPVLEIKGSVSR